VAFPHIPVIPGDASRLTTYISSLTGNGSTAAINNANHPGLEAPAYPPVPPDVGRGFFISAYSAISLIHPLPGSMEIIPSQESSVAFSERRK
jgi:hypothetical protein